jgi:hypothetical protein
VARERLALCIARGGRLAQPNAREVFLGRIQQRACELGRLAEQNDQQPRGKRIERACMARLLRPI